MVHGPPMLDKVESNFIKQVWELQWARKKLQMVTKIVVFVEVRACWAQKDNLLLRFIVDYQSNRMIYLQKYREEAAGCSL